MRRKLFIRSLLAGASVVMISAGSAIAAKTPNIRVSDSNQVPACVTPERLMEFVKTRYKKMPRRFNDVASYYQVHGNNIGIRWDYAFYQMLVETNYLKFRTPRGRMGDVKPYQNNFAGLGATGGGVPGDRFKTISDGVLAHLQHIQMYSGHRVANPIAPRTRKIQDWNLILPWAQAFGREVTFTDLTTKWSPGDRGYSNDIEYTAKRFRSRYCGGPDRIITAKAPATSRPATQAVAATKTAASVPASNKLNLNAVAYTASAGSAVTAASKSGSYLKITDTAKVKARNAKSARKAANGVASTGKAINGVIPDDVATGGTASKGQGKTYTVASGDSPNDNAKNVAANIPGTAIAAKCAVWTASYGGGKSLLIRSTARGMVNYTALVVHEGQESREANAYIKAWAKGGKAIGEYGSSDKALTRAYELCPQS